MFRFSVRPNRAGQIHWREWGEEAFQEAHEQDKPIVLFIVAFWCGVSQRMDETALSSDEAIALLNAFFVPVRVEESQRPDVDLRYNQTGGWPTIVFLTPNGDPLVSVNALDSEDFVTLLARVVDAHERARITSSGAVEAEETAIVTDTAPAHPAPLGPQIVAEIAGMLEGLADPVHGGFGSQDKLLHTEANALLLHLYETTGERAYLDHVCLTLDAMQRSRTFDAIDGGFFRYSSRRDWQEPHPEKLLDDQAALLEQYLHAYVLTDVQAYREVANGLIDYLDRALLDATTGMYFGCQDYVRLASPAPAGHPYGTAVIDPFVYCDANAHAAAALLDAWWLLGRADCEIHARTMLEWLWQNLRAADGGMCHAWNGQPHTPGLLIDSLATARALLDAFAVFGDTTYLDRCKHVAEQILQVFRCPSGGFFDIAKPGPGALQTRMTVLAQNAALAGFFVRLADLSGEAGYRDASRWALQPFPNSHRNYGAFAAGFGHSLSLLLSEPVPVMIAGRPGDADVRQLLRQALTQLQPRRPVIQFRSAPASGKAQIEVG